MWIFTARLDAPQAGENEIAELISIKERVEEWGSALGGTVEIGVANPSSPEISWILDTELTESEVQENSELWGTVIGKFANVVSCVAEKTPE